MQTSPPYHTLFFLFFYLGATSTNASKPRPYVATYKTISIIHGKNIDFKGTDSKR
jgi:hypothetical protein